MFSFGILGEIDVRVASVAFLLTIFFLTGFEFLTGALEYVVRENPIYNKMLQRIYKELMIMGFITFVTAIYLAADSQSPLMGYTTEIDFVGYITFFVAIFFVAHAMYIMLLSMYTTKMYDRLHAATAADLIVEYTSKIEKTIERSIFEKSYFALTSLKQAFEFKIIYALFRDTYWLPGDFDYGAYLGQSFERYSLKMINIGHSSWLIMIVLCGINYARIELSNSVDFLSCDALSSAVSVNSSSTHAWNPFESESMERRKLVHEISHDCSYLHLKIFIVCGSLVAFYVFVLFVIGRFYLKRLIARAGVTSGRDYYDFLMLEESLSLNQSAMRRVEVQVNNNKGKRSSRRRMSIGTFRNNVNTLLKEKSEKDNDADIYKSISEKVRTRKSYIGRAVENVRKTLSSRHSAISPLSRERSANRSGKSLLLSSESPQSARKSIAKSNESSQPQQEDKGGSGQPTRRKNLILTLSKAETKKNLFDNSSEQDSMDSLTTIEQFKLKKIKQYRRQRIERSKSNKKMMMSYLRDSSEKQRSKRSDDVDMKLSEDFSDIYFFRSPQLYFKMVEIAIMLNSLYLSLWACNFITVVNTQFNRSPFYHLIMLVPLLVVLPTLGEVVKVSSLLSAIADLDLDIIGSVLEEAEEKSRLVGEVREKILRRIAGKNADKMAMLKELYAEIDSNGNGQITKHEFRDMLRALSLHYSDDKFKRLFAAIDNDASGVIDMDELLNLVFPSVAKNQEVNRRKLLLQQSSDAIDKLHSNSSKRLLNGVKIVPSTNDHHLNNSHRHDGVNKQQGRAHSQQPDSECPHSSAETVDSVDSSAPTASSKSMAMDKRVTNMRMSKIMRANVPQGGHEMQECCFEDNEEDEASIANTTVAKHDNLPTSTTSKSPRGESPRGEIHSDINKVKRFEEHLDSNSSIHSSIRSFDEDKLDAPEMESAVAPLPLDNCSGGVTGTDEKSATDERDSHQISPLPESEEHVELSNVPEEITRVSQQPWDESSDISCLGDSVCMLDGASALEMGEHSPAEFYSYESDDDSLMTATIKALPTEPHQRKPKLNKEPSMELQALLGSFKGSRRVNEDSHATFTLSSRAASALYKLSNDQMTNLSKVPQNCDASTEN